MRALLLLLLAAVGLCAQSFDVNVRTLTTFPTGTSTGQTGQLRMRELRANGSNYIGLRAADALASSITFTLPDALPGSTSCITSTTTGVLAYDATCGGGGGYTTVQEEGTGLTARAIINFIGAAITATDDGSTKTLVTLSQSPASASVVGTGRTISTTTPITGGGDFSSDRTFACGTCATTDTSQTISGAKTFSVTATFSDTVATVDLTVSGNATLGNTAFDSHTINGSLAVNNDMTGSGGWWTTSYVRADGGFRVSGSTGVSVTFTCGVGEYVKNLTTVLGIVTAASCGT